MKKISAILLFIPLSLVFLVSDWLALATLVAQFFFGWMDLQHANLLNLFNPFTNFGGSGTWIDSIVAGEGASGGSAVRYFSYFVYAVICAGCLEGFKKLAKVLKN